MIMGLIKKPLQKRSKLLVESIIHSAIIILKEPQKISFTTNNIAHISGVSIGSLYQYFESKEDILDEVIFFYFTEQHDLILDSIIKIKFRSRLKYIDDILINFYQSIFDDLNFSNALSQKAQSLGMYDVIKSLDKKLIQDIYNVIKVYLPELTFKDLEVVIYAIKGINMQYGNNLTKSQALEYTKKIAYSLLR